MSGIKEAVERIIAPKIMVQCQVGTVKSVDESAMTCDVEISGSPDMTEVRLRSVIDEVEKGILIVPKVGSKVLVGLIDNKKVSAFIAQVSEVDKISFIVDDINLNGDQFGGLVKSEKLADAVNKLSDEVNDLKQIFTTWVPAPNDGGAGLKAGVATWLTPLAPFVKSDFENEKVKHG